MDPSSRRTYYPQIDSLRFMAFLLVFLHHTAPIEGSVPAFFLYLAGAYGVDLFFVVSAFLLFDLLCKEHKQTGAIQVRSFFVRRVLRIWPLYFFFLSVVIGCTAWQSGLAQADWGRLLGLVVFVDNFATFGAQAYNPWFMTGHLWTISTEEQFYLAVPALSLLFCTARPRTTVLLLCSLFVASIGLRAAFISAGWAHPSVWVMHVTRLEPFVLGFALSYWHNRGSISRVAGWLGLGCFIAIPLYVYGRPDAFQLWNPHRLFAPTAVAVAFTGLLTFAISDPGFARPVLHNRVLAYLGKISFGLYVWHTMAQHFYREGTARWIPLSDPVAAWWVAFAGALALTILVSIASYHLVEVPFLRWKSKFTLVPNREP